ncbi:MAG: hypothetical protein DCC71_25885, partial [Proteobacteria bacterium]
LELAREVLERAGFRVLAATSGAAALAAARGPHALRAALLDLAMPDMNGEELLAHLRALQPDLPVVLVTGYDAAHAAQRFAALRLEGFLHKPWEPEELVAAVRRATQV